MKLNKEFEKISWKNEDVAKCYETIPIEVLYSYTVIGGLDVGCDIDLAYPYIKHAQSIIEVGAGYGRVIHHLLRKGYAGKLYALERSKTFCTYLKKHYQSVAEIIHSDLQIFQPPHKIDAVLCLWSNISDFPQVDQSKIFKHLSSWLSPNGILVMETINHLLKPKNATRVTGQSYVISLQNGTLYGYNPSIEEMHDYAKNLGFEYIQHINYKTSTGRERVIHLFSHIPSTILT